MSCLSCHAEVTNGLALCELCQHYVSTALPYMATYFRNLSRWKPGRAGSRPVPGSREPSGVATVRGDRVWDALDEADNWITRCARELADDRPGHMARVVSRILAMDEERRFRMLCALFARRLTTVATLGWAGDFVRAIGEHETVLRQLTERVVPGWYAGACRNPIGFDDEGAALRCGADTYVVPGLTWVTCGACGATTYARDHLEVVLDEARDWVARPKALAEAVVALIDTEPSVPRMYDRIRRWATDEALVPIHRTTVRDYVWDDDADRFVVATLPSGPARYLLGDVLDLTLRRTTRADRISANTAAAS